MFLKNRSSDRRPFPLKPFLMKIRGGHLLGLAMEPTQGAPCAACVAKWLSERNVFHEMADLADLHVRRDLLGDLLVENSPHVFFEIMEDGTFTRLEGVVFPHPSCECNKSNYVPPEEWTKKTNFAFSPIQQLRCARYGTPDGNLWLSHASGISPVDGKLLVASAVAAEREDSRLLAVEKWLSLTAMARLKARAREGESLEAQVVQTGQVRALPPEVMLGLGSDGLAAGSSPDDAMFKAFHSLAKARTLTRYASAMKSPMLVVGANNWVRTKVPFFLLQQYDLHLLFYPNSTPSWVVGVAAFSRQNAEEKPLFAFASGPVIGQAIEEALGRILQAVRPPENDEAEMPVLRDAGPGVAGTKSEEQNAKAQKLNLWWTHWIYRCPKIALRDVLHLEPYPRDLVAWKGYFQDGEPEVTVLTLNEPAIPTGIRYLVKATQANTATNVRNVRGIGVWAAMHDATA